MKNGFTMAEVLITLAVIGVVAAISLPRFMDNMTERANSERHANIAQKVTQAMEQMRAHGLLNTPYPTTEAFVDELQNYLKIAKRCDKDHIADCWPTKTVITGDGKEQKISNIQTGKDLQLQTDTNNVGLILADGAPIILNYDPNAQTFDVGDKVTASTVGLPVGGRKSKEFAYTSDVTSSIDFITDVNGKKKPNSETVNTKMHDIRSLHKAKIGGCFGIRIPGIGCVFDIGDIQPVTDPNVSAYVKSWCPSGSGASWACTDYAMGAKIACEELGMELPDIGTLTSIYNKKSEYLSLPQSGIYRTVTPRSGSIDWMVLDFSDGSNGNTTPGHNNVCNGCKGKALCIGD